MNKISYFNTYKELVMVDLVTLKQNIFNKIIDLAIWVILTMMVTSYIMPYFGLAQNFGPFQLGGLIAAAGLFELYGHVFEVVADIAGDRMINYGLTLPMPSWMTFISKATAYAITYMILSSIMLPIGAACIWHQFSFASISYGKLLIAIFVQNIFYACLVLWVASFIANISHMQHVWARVIFPMWFMGGFQFSWKAVHSKIPALAYVDLLNPMMYITESTRAALLGQEGYLPFWLCINILVLTSFFCMYFALKRMQQRLDFV